MRKVLLVLIGTITLACQSEQKEGLTCRKINITPSKDTVLTISKVKEANWVDEQNIQNIAGFVGIVNDYHFLDNQINSGLLKKSKQSLTNLESKFHAAFESFAKSQGIEMTEKLKFRLGAILQEYNYGWKPKYNSPQPLVLEMTTPPVHVYIGATYSKNSKKERIRSSKCTQEITQGENSLSLKASYHESKVMLDYYFQTIVSPCSDKPIINKPVLIEKNVEMVIVEKEYL